MRLPRAKGRVEVGGTAAHLAAEIAKRDDVKGGRSDDNLCERTSRQRACERASERAKPTDAGDGAKEKCSEEKRVEDAPVLGSSLASLNEVKRVERLLRSPFTGRVWTGMVGRGDQHEEWMEYNGDTSRVCGRVYCRRCSKLMSVKLYLLLKFPPTKNWRGLAMTEPVEGERAKRVSVSTSCIA